MHVCICVCNKRNFRTCQHCSTPNKLHNNHTYPWSLFHFQNYVEENEVWALKKNEEKTYNMLGIWYWIQRGYCYYCYVERTGEIRRPFLRWVGGEGSAIGFNQWLEIAVLGTEYIHAAIIIIEESSIQTVNFQSVWSALRSVVKKRKGKTKSWIWGFSLVASVIQNRFRHPSAVGSPTVQHATSTISILVHEPYNSRLCFYERRASWATSGRKKTWISPANANEAEEKTRKNSREK